MRILVLATLMLSMGCATATAPPASAPTHTIRVVGEGEAAGEPDIARIQLGVEARAASVQAAVESANQRMRNVITALEQHGVLPKDVQTSNLSVRFERSRHEPPRPQRLESASPNSSGRESAATSAPGTTAAPPKPQPEGWFVMQNTLAVTVRKLDDLGRILEAALQAGANNVHGLNLEIEDPTSLEQQARQQAVESAREKALRLARAASVRLGRLVELSETAGGYTPTPGPGIQLHSLERASVPTETGQLHVKRRVQLVFEIEQ